MSGHQSPDSFGPITPAGLALLEEVAYRQANDIMREYGATPIPRSRPKAPMRFHLLDVDRVSRIHPIKWRVKGVLPETGIAAIFGKSGSAKTFLALDLTLTLAKGLPWFGNRSKGCPVVYVCLEGEAGLSNRVTAYRKHSAIGGKVYFLTQPFDLLQPMDVPELAKAIKAYGAAGGVVIIDTLNRAAPGMDENSSADMGRVIGSTKQLQSLIGGLVLLVHHSGKDAAKGMRGHSSLFAALDAAIEVSRTGDHREWQLAKSKDGVDGVAHPFKLEVVDLGLDQEGDMVTSCIIKACDSKATDTAKPLTPALRQGMDSFMAAAAQGIGTGDKRVCTHVDEWRTEFNRITTSDTPESKKKAFQRVRGQLVDLGKLVVQDDVYSLPNGFTPIAGHGT